jgi:hypothetical protein
LPPAAALADDPYANLVVLYRVQKVAAGGYYAGVLTRSQLEIDGDNLVKFTSEHFGTFQVVYLTAPVSSVHEVAVPASLLRRHYYIHGVKVANFDNSQQVDSGYQGWVLHLTEPKVSSGTTSLLSGLMIHLDAGQ